MPLHISLFFFSVHPFSHLSWLVLPVTAATEGEPIPDFSVQSDSDVTEEVELFIQGQLWEFILLDLTHLWPVS